MKNTKECITIAEEIKNLENEISEREGHSNEGVKFRIPLPDEITDKNNERLYKLKQKYASICG